MSFAYRHRRALLIVSLVFLLLVGLGELARSSQADRRLRGRATVCHSLGLRTYLLLEREHPGWGPWRLYYASHHCELVPWRY